MHLGSMTALSFLNLDEGVTQMRLAEGSLNFRVSELRQAMSTKWTLLIWPSSLNKPVLFALTLMKMGTPRA